MTRGRFALWVSLLSLSVCATIYLLTSSIDTLQELWVLPAGFAVSVTILVVPLGREASAGFLEYPLVALQFVRLVGIPLLIAAAGGTYLQIPPLLTGSEYGAGCRYMAYEAVTVALILALVRFRARRADARAPRERPAVVHAGAQSPQILLILMGAALLVVPEVRGRFTFFTSPITGTAREIASHYDPAFNTLANVANLARIVVPGVLIALAFRSHQKRGNSLLPFLAVLGSVVPNLFFVSTSRASFFVPLVAAIVALCICFPRARSAIVLTAGSGLVAATLIVTINKSFATGSTPALADTADYLSTYLMGPKEYAVGTRTIHQFGDDVNLGTLFNDVVGNVPVVSSFGDPINRTSQLYNWSYLGISTIVGGGMITPASIQGALYLGWLAGPIAALPGLLLAAWGGRYLGRPNQEASASYVAAFALITGLLFYTNSFSTVVAFIAFPLVPLVLLIALDRGLGRALAASSGR